MEDFNFIKFIGITLKGLDGDMIITGVLFLLGWVQYSKGWLPKEKFIKPYALLCSFIFVWLACECISQPWKIYYILLNGMAITGLCVLGYSALRGTKWEFGQWANTNGKAKGEVKDVVPKKADLV
jgi:hypothetical protein